MPRLLAAVLLACLAVLPTAAVAQSTYYVNGATGLDVPTNGTSPASAWRTIGYALANVAPGPSTRMVHVQGDQSYGPASNGEFFPLVLPPQVVLRGVPGPTGQRPRLVVPAGGTGLLLPATVAAPYTSLPLLEDFDVHGGDHGFRCGAGANTTQLVELRKCGFGGQSTNAIVVQASGGTSELTLTDSALGATAGGGPILTGVLIQGVVAKLTFLRCHVVGGRTIARSPHAGAAWLAQFDARGCNFEQTTLLDGLEALGVFVAPGQHTISDCRFVQSSAVSDMSYRGSNALTFTRCAFAHSSLGYFNGAMADKSITVTVDRCAFDTSAGASCSSPYRGSYAFYVRDTVFRNFGTAFSLSSAGEDAGTYLTLERCRLIDGVTAVSSYGVAENGSVDVHSCLIARCSGPAIAFSGFQGPGAPAMQQFRITQTTIADCQSGIVIGVPAPTTSISGVAFDGNGADITAPPSVYCGGCLTNGPAVAGIGHTANVGLIRPQYKLAGNSPCIDMGGGGAGSTDYEGDPRSLAGTPTGAPVPDIGADEYAPYGSLRPIGFPGRTPTGIQPAIATNSTSARLGVAYDVRLIDAGAASVLGGPGFAFLASGLRDLAAPLPFDLAAFQMPGSYLWMDPQETMGPIAISSTGTAGVTYQLPYLPQLAGLPIVHQWLVALPAPHGLVTSNALRVSFAP